MEGIRLDRLGAQGPLLLPGPAPAEASSENAPPKARSSEDNDVIGWCTFSHCGRPFQSWEDHVSHQRRCHYGGELDIICDLCLERGLVSEQTSHLRLHRMSDTACPLCSGRFVGDISDHMKQFHHVQQDGSVPAVLGWCPRGGCGGSFSSWEDFVQHNIHQHWMVSNPVLVCRWCLRQHKEIAEAEEHSQAHFNPSVNHVKCEICPARFFNFVGYGLHMKLFHRHV